MKQNVNMHVYTLEGHHAKVQAILPEGWKLRIDRDKDGTTQDTWRTGENGGDFAEFEVDKDNWFFNDPHLWQRTFIKIGLWAIGGIDSQSSQEQGGTPRFFILAYLYRRYGARPIKEELERLTTLITSPRPADW